MQGRRAQLVTIAAAVAGLVFSAGIGSVQASSSAAATGQTGSYPGPTWRAVKVVKLNRQAWFQDATATGPDDAWAVGDLVGATGTASTGGFAMRWNGTNWRRVALPVSSFVPVSVSARGQSGIWIFGYRPEANVDANLFPADALIWNKGSWRVLPLPASASISWTYLWDLQSAVVTADDVWVLGTTQGINATNVHSVLWNWNGSAWIRHPLPVAGADSLSAVPGAVWVVTVANNGISTAYQWTGSLWRRWRLPDVIQGTVAADSAHSVWIGGGSTSKNRPTTYLLHWTGRGWSRSQTPLAEVLGTTTSDGRGGVWFSQWAHFSRGKWYEPSAWPTWRGCNGTGSGAVAAVPGTSATWYAGICSSGKDDYMRPIIGLTGRL